MAARGYRVPVYFGYVDVAYGENFATISIIDQLSGVKFEFQIEEVDLIMSMGCVINDCVVFLTEREIFRFSHRTESITAIRIAGVDEMKWINVASIKCRRVPLSPELKLEQRWSHWIEYQRHRMRPSPPSTNVDSFLVCSLTGIFLVHNRITESATKIVEVRRIYDSRHKDERITRSLIPGTAIKVSAGNDHVALLVKNSDFTVDLYMYGSGNHGEMGRGDLLSLEDFEAVESLREIDPILDMSTGNWHTCVLTDNGDVYGWGWNKCDQLGYSPDEFSIQPLPYPFDLDKKAISIACGDEWTSIHFEDGTARIFGESEVNSGF